MIWRGLLLVLAVFLSSSSILEAQVLVVPRRHDRPPGPALSPQEAVAKMTVPEGFTVDIVAAEPDVVNPVAMFIDEKGRFWITESYEYPRREPGPGRDRIKVLEDTDGDGKVDKTTIFAEGLNIPSGIAVGHGGVWVANAPDLLFLQDTDGDLKADKTEVLLTGFGRTDTHELPNSFTWGPDGWLYGLNGVFNYCDVTYGKDNPNAKPDHPGWKFTCALFRIHPRTREFQVFCEGTSNPWGLAINDKGDFFVSACVIDHLWHLTERGYYIRQGGPYPAHTWPIKSIVKHEHQKAAYCGITWFDSDAYPAEYRNTLYMGNIHGNCINADVIEPQGATYAGKAHPGFPAKADAWKNDPFGVIRKTGDEKNPKLADLLQANDQWFMPVVQKVGPDGCLYVLDWYDQYHCYQDANADPAGIDRAKGRLYRLRYKDNPYVKPFDLAKKTDDELIGLLRDSNVFYRETAQRLLAERNTAGIFTKLLARVKAVPGLTRDPYRELFALASLTLPATPEWSEVLFKNPDPVVRAWGLRLAGDFPSRNDTLAQNAMAAMCLVMVEEESPAVALQAVVAASKLAAAASLKMEVFQQALSRSPLDETVAHVAWETMKPLIERDPVAFLRSARARLDAKRAVSNDVLTRALEVVVAHPETPFDALTSLVDALCRSDSAGKVVAAEAIRQLAGRVQNRSIRDDRLNELRQALATSPQPAEIDLKSDSYARWRTLLAASWGDESAKARALKAAEDELNADFAHLQFEVLDALISSRDPRALALARVILTSTTHRQPSIRERRAMVLTSLSRSDDSAVAALVLELYPRFTSDLQTKILDLLSERPAWSAALLTAIQAERIPKNSLNLNQLRKVAASKDAAIQAAFRNIYGSVRETRSPDRDRVISNTRNLLDTVPGDPHAGVAVFKKVCAQCHKIYGEGAEVGPEITLNGRNNWEQLLSNVLDPSLVIGKGYQARILATADGRVLTGLPVEETDTQVVLKVQGGKLETIPRSEIDAYKVSELSMMPEQLEKQLTAQELADLFAYLALDKPPTDPSAKLLNGAPRPKGR